MNSLDNQISNQVDRPESNHFSQEEEISPNLAESIQFDSTKQFVSTTNHQHHQHNSTLPSNIDEQSDVAADI